MRNKNLIFGLMVFFSVSCCLVYAQPFETIQIGNGTQKFSKPVWSPNGEKLAFWGPGGIYVCKWDGSEQPKKIFGTFGEDLMWASDSELVYWQRKFIKIEQEGKRPKKETKESLRIVTQNGQEKIIKEGKRASAPCKLRNGMTVYYQGGEPYDILTQTKVNRETLANQVTVASHYPPAYDPVTKKAKYEDTDIWISRLDGSFKKRVTSGKHYYLPQLSPDGTKISASDGWNVYILDLDGNVLANLGRGDCEVWSPNSDKMAFIMTVEDGHNILSSDLFVANVDGSGKIQVTNTPDEIEMDPQWSPNGNAIVYWIENMGKIFVVKIK